MPLSQQNLLASTVEEWITDQVVDSFFDSSEVTMRMYKSKVGDMVDGGDQLKWPVQTAGVTGTATVNLTLDVPTFPLTTNPQFLKTAVLDWVTYGLSVKYPKQDLDLYNRGRARVINLARVHLETLKNSFKDFLAEKIWDEAPAATDFVSLPVAINSNSIGVPRNYAGVTDSVFSSQLTNLAGVNPTVRDIIEMINLIRMKFKGSANLIVCGFEAYAILEGEARADERLVRMIQQNVPTELGIPTFAIHGAPVVVDPFLDKSGNVGAGPADDPTTYIGKNRIYVLSTETFGYIPMLSSEHEDGYHNIEGLCKMTDFVDLTPISREHAYQVNIQATGVPILMDRRKNGVLFNMGIA